jgi:hypothetical protein
VAFGAGLFGELFCDGAFRCNLKKLNKHLMLIIELIEFRLSRIIKKLPTGHTKNTSIQQLCTRHFNYAL